MKFIRGLLSVILSIVFIIVLSVGIFAYSMNSFVSKENIKNIVADEGIENLLDFNISNNSESDINYLEIPEIKELVDKLIDQSVDYVLDNKKAPEIVDEDIDKIINSDYFKEILGRSLTEEEKDQYSNEIKDAYEEINGSLESELASVKSELFENEILSIILAKNFIPLVIIALIVIVLLIGLCRWSWYRPFSWIGISMIFAGGINLALNNIIKPTLITDSTASSQISVLENLLTKWLNNSYVVIVIGLILFILYFIFKNNFAKEKSITN